jgi:hypothetical protein
MAKYKRLVPRGNAQMPLSASGHHLLERATALLPVSEEELIYKGIAASVSERILDGTLETLEQQIHSEGVSPDDHTRYTDRLEWRAITHELKELLHLLETL